MPGKGLRNKFAECVGSTYLMEVIYFSRGIREVMQHANESLNVHSDMANCCRLCLPEQLHNDWLTRSSEAINATGKKVHILLIKSDLFDLCLPIRPFVSSVN